MSIAFLPFVLLSVIGRGARFFLVAALVRLGGEKLEATLLTHVERIGWAVLLTVVMAVVVYYLWH